LNSLRRERVVHVDGFERMGIVGKEAQGKVKCRIIVGTQIFIKARFHKL